MASNVTAADHIGAVPVTAMSCPDAGNKLTVAYHRQAVAALLANDALNTTNISTKVAKAGDTMTGKLDINQGTSNTNALEADGNGTGSGAVFTGGSNGKGAEIQAGGGNNIGAYCVGAGTGPGVSALGGASGSGVVALAGGGNKYGVDATGAGTGAGVYAIGGATGNGAILNAGGGNANGAAATGAGTGSGITCTGGTTGPGITATPGTASTAAVPQKAGAFAGYIEITADEPAQGVSPAANFPIYGPNIAKACCSVEVDGFSGPYTKQFAFNVNVVDDVATGVYSVTFQRALKDANYSVTFGTDTIGLNAACTSRTASGFEFTVYDTNTKLASASAVAVDFQVFGLR